MLVLVTGCSKGIGYEIVKKFCADPKAQVVAVSRSTGSLDQLQKKSSLHNLTIVKADLASVKGRRNVLNTVKARRKPLDILINNAGSLVNKPFPKISEKELQQVYSTNVFAPFMLIQGALPLMNGAKRAHIVNISSMGGVQGSSKFPGLSAYSSSKAALCGLTECLAEELKTKNISVNCLALGAVQTEMLSKAFPGYKAPLSASEMAEFITQFSQSGHHYFNGKILPVSSTTP
jgi:NAD(P)-dependent dehydrogenase (short-subunit alcohol dehydrogenase family)